MTKLLAFFRNRGNITRHENQSFLDVSVVDLPLADGIANTRLVVVTGCRVDMAVSSLPK